MATVNDILKAGIEAARAGKREEALQLLRQVTEQDPRNEVGWMWLASVTTTESERRRSLEEALRLNPENTRARDALAQLSGYTSARTTSAPTHVAAPAAGARGPRVPTTRRVVKKSGGMTIIYLGLAGLVVVIMVMLTYLSQNNFSQISATNAAYTQQARLAALPSASPTFLADAVNNTVNNAAVISTPAPTVFMGVIVTVNPEDLPTQAASFTPTFTATATNTATATATTYPINLFTLYFTALDGQNGVAQLYKAAGDGSQMQLVSRESFLYPVADPSGTRIAYLRQINYVTVDGVETTAAEIFVAPINEQDNGTRISELGGKNVSRLSWSPDGTALVVGSDKTGDMELWYVRADGSEMRQLTNSPGIDTDPSWSPDGEKILFASERANQIGSGLTEVFVFYMFDQSAIQLTDAGGSSYAPSWSPDGSHFAYLSDRNGDSDVFTETKDGQEPLLITVDDGGAEDIAVTYTPNGQALVFLSNRNHSEIFRLYQTDTAGRSVTRLQEDASLMTNMFFVANGK